MQEVMVIGGAALGLFGLLLLTIGLWNYRYLRLIRALPTTPLRQLAAAARPSPGRVYEVQGAAEAAGPLTTLLSRTAAVYCRYTVERRRQRPSGPFSNDRTVARWKTIHRSAGTENEFYLTDQSGRLLIQPRNAHCAFEATWQAVYSRLEEYPPHVLEFLRSKWISPRIFGIFPCTLRLQEYSIAEGEPVFAIATLRQEQTGSRGGRKCFLARRSRWRNGPFLLLKGKETQAIEHFAGRARLGCLTGGVLLTLGAALAGAGLIV